MPTIAWKQMRTMLTGGRSAGGTASRPSTRALGSWKASTESILGIPMPNFTSPSWYQPRMWIGAPFSVRPRPSSAASLVGWDSATSRAAQSPTSSCTGEASAAMVSGTTSAVRS